MKTGYRTEAIRVFTSYKNIVNYYKFRKFRINPRYLKIKSYFSPLSCQSIDICSIHILSNSKAKNVLKKYKILLEELRHDPIIPINLFG
jgi:hypothetical protein